jgi:hypothetical protein
MPLPDQPEPEQRPNPQAVLAECDVAPQCWRCGRQLADVVTRPWSITCQRRKAVNRRPVAEA